MLRRVLSSVLFCLGCASLVGWVVVVAMTAFLDFNWTRENLAHLALGTLWPFWLVGGACLLASFSLRFTRRTPGRGFAVEAGGGGPAPGIEPLSRRADNIPPP